MKSFFTAITEHLNVFLAVSPQDHVFTRFCGAGFQLQLSGWNKCSEGGVKHLMDFRDGVQGFDMRLSYSGDG